MAQTQELFVGTKVPHEHAEAKGHTKIAKLLREKWEQQYESKIKNYKKKNYFLIIIFFFYVIKNIRSGLTVI